MNNGKEVVMPEKKAPAKKKATKKAPAKKPVAKEAKVAPAKKNVLKDVLGRAAELVGEGNEPSDLRRAYLVLAELEDYDGEVPEIKPVVIGGAGPAYESPLRYVLDVGKRGDGNASASGFACEILRRLAEAA